jgi:hypothetical protein
MWGATMSEVLKEFPIDGKRKGKSSWDEFADGRVYRLRRGVDFKAAPVNKRTAAYAYAKQKKLKVRSRVEGDSIIVQFSKKPFRRKNKRP